MEQANVWSEFLLLPSEAQQQAADFIAFLRARYTPPRTSKRGMRASLADETFVGIWRDRDDMADSSAWVRTLREREW